MTSSGTRLSERSQALPLRAVPDRSTRLYNAAITLVVLAAGGFWLSRSGSSSLFTDEALTWVEAHSGLATLATVVRRQEINPLAYPVFLHGWLKVAPSSSEWWLRLPSVIAGILLLAAIAWVTSLVADRRAALIAVVLGAVSPFLFDFVQEVRAYAFMMLAVTVSVAAALQAERSGGWQRRWLVVSIVAGALAQAVHYTAWLVLAPLGVYLLARSGLSRRATRTWCVIVALAGLVWAPLLVAQMRSGHNGWLKGFANLSGGHFGDVFGAPFSGRIFQPGWRSLLGAAIVLAAVLVCLVVRRGTVAVANRTADGGKVPLLVALALTSPVALALATLSGHPALLIRYAAVAVPFMIAVMAIALMAAPPWSVAAIVGVLVLAVANVRAADQPSGHYRDYRGALTYLRARYRPGDLVVGLGTRLLAFDFDYYIPRLLPHARVVVLPPAPPAKVRATPPVQAALRARQTIWFVNSNFPRPPSPRPAGYTVTAKRTYVAVGVLEVTRLQPRAGRSSVVAATAPTRR